MSASRGRIDLRACARARQIYLFISTMIIKRHAAACLTHFIVYLPERTECPSAPITRHAVL